MNAHEQIDAVLKQAAELETLEQRFDATTEKHRLDLELTDSQRQQKLAAAKQQVANRLTMAERLRRAASDTLLTLLPTAEPPPIADPLALFLCQHRLYSMKETQRLAVFHKAIESSDRLIYDSFINAPSWLYLVSDLDVKQGREWWNHRHSQHNDPSYGPLSAAVERMSHAVTRLSGKIA